MAGEGSERGAALVEYALLVVLVAAVAMASIDLLGRVADQELERSASGAAGTWSSGGISDPGGSSGGGTTTTPGPPPTNPGSTAPTPTTTTTTAPRPVATPSITQPSSWSTGWFQWAGSAQVVLVDAGGRPLVGAQVQVRVTTSGGATETVTVTTDGSGRATVEVGPYSWFGSWGGTGSVDVQVVGVTAGDATWDGTQPTTTITAP